MKKMFVIFVIFVGMVVVLVDGFLGMIGMDYVGFMVFDFDQVVDFFIGIFGCLVFYLFWLFFGGDSIWMEDYLNVDLKVIILVMWLVCCGNGVNLEIFQYMVLDQNFK